MKTTKTVQEASLYYVEKLAFGLCSIPEGSKAPRTSGWNTPEQYIDTIDKVKTRIVPKTGIGLIHEASHTCSLDIDHLDWSRTLFNEFGVDLDEMLDQGLRIDSGKKNRAKAIFRIPEKLKGYQRKALSWPDPETGDNICVFELRGGNVQDVLPPSIHPETKQPYQWIDAPWDNGDEVPELPDILASVWLDWDKFAPQMRGVCPWSKKEPEAPQPKPRENHSGDSVIQQFNDAYDAAMMLESFGYRRTSKNKLLAPNSSTKMAGVILFEDNTFFSHHGSCPFGDGHKHDPFDIFVELEHAGNFTAAIKAAKTMLGIEDRPDVACDVIDLATFAGMKKQEQEQDDEEEATEEPIPDELLNPPGILGEIAEHCLGSMIMPQPVFAVNAALLSVATIAAQRVEGPTGGRTNLYLTSLGPSGCGKEYPRTYVKNLLTALNLPDLIAGEEIASGQAILTRAAIEPRSMFQIDEFGLFLQTVTDKKAAGPKAEIMRHLMSLFSKTDTVIKGTEYANQKINERAEITYPCINLHGSSTEETFLNSLESQHIYDGALNRFIVTATQDARPKKNLTNRLDAKKPTISICDWYDSFDCWAKAYGAQDLNGLNKGTAAKVHITEEAAELLAEYDAEVDERYLKAHKAGSAYVPLYARSAEHVYKIALICGVGMPHHCIDLQSARWAIKFVDYWTEQLIVKATEISSSSYGNDMNQIMKYVGQSGAKGITRGRLTNKTTTLREMPSERFESIIETLVKNERLIQAKLNPKGSGRPSIKYWLYDNYPFFDGSVNC